MPIIARIGRKSLRSRLLIASIYAALAAGAVSMIYPFLLLVSGSTKSGVDTPESMVIPQFLKSDSGLFQKHLECFFNEMPSLYGSVCGVDKPAFETAQLPSGSNPKLVAAWTDFLEQARLPQHFYAASCISVQTSRSVSPSNLRLFKAEMSKLCGGDIDKFNSDMGTSLTDWGKFRVLDNDIALRITKPGSSKWDISYAEFKQSLPLKERIFFSIPGNFAQSYLKAQYGNDLAAFNKAWGCDLKSWSEIALPRTVPSPAQKAARADWESFVRDILNPLWIRIAPSANALYAEFLKEKYDGRLDDLNRRHEAAYTSFNDVRADGEPPAKGVASSDWAAFLSGWKDPGTGKSFKAPLDSLSVSCADFLFQDWLRAKYGELSSVNAALGTDFKSWDSIAPPQLEAIHQDFLKGKAALRWEFCTRNFISVFDYLILHGSALFNTVIYCGLTILCALVVNPIAAYALSRFKLPSTYKVLLFLMMTMAFPPVVTQIPNFLMLRDLNLLNTYAALILPGLANGYSIFLLKGFFDSLPQELYESASIDGASEIRIFLQITMSLSKPILAVIALNAFTAAYGNFMMALLVCQDRSMWTIMPFLFELQQNGCQGLVFASLLVAAVPTLIIFTLCQNVIMRGIVVPVEK